MGNCCSNTAPRGINPYDGTPEINGTANIERHDVLLLGAGCQGKTTFMKQVSYLYKDEYKNDDDRTYWAHTLFHNLTAGLQQLLEFEGIKAWSSSHFVRELLKDQFDVEMTQEDALALIEPMRLSVKAYLEAYDNALRLEGYRRPIGQDPGKMPKITDQRFSAVANENDLQVCKNASDPTTDEFLQEALGIARIAQDELKLKIVGVTWPSRDRQLGTTGVASKPCDWIDEAFDPGTKTKERVVAKAQYKYHGNYARVRDISRLALQFDTFERLANALDMIRQRFPEILEVENRFAYPTVLGWRDITILLELVLSDGLKHICEVQLHHKCMSDARKGAHSHYRTIRELLQRIVPVEKQTGVVELILSEIRENTKWYGPLGWVYENSHSHRDFEETCENNRDKLKEILHEIWSIPTIQNSFHNDRREIMEMDNFAYLCERMDDIIEESYIPTFKDILMGYTRTTGIYNVDTRVAGTELKVYDTGGQRSERRKWVHVLKDHNQTYLFLVRVTDYDLPLFEGTLGDDDPNNRLYDSIQLFDKLTNTPNLKNGQFVIVFTHIDELPEKLSRVPIESIDLWKDLASGDMSSSPDQVVDAIESRLLSKAPSDMNIRSHRINCLDTNAVEKIMTEIASNVPREYSGGLV